MYGFNDIRQAEMHTVESFIPERSFAEDEIAIENVLVHKAPRIDRIPNNLSKQKIKYHVLRYITLFFILYGIFFSRNHGSPK